MRDHKRLSGTKAGQPQRQTPKNFHDAAPGPLATRQETEQIAFFLPPPPPSTPPSLSPLPLHRSTADQVWKFELERESSAIATKLS